MRPTRIVLVLAVLAAALAGASPAAAGEPWTWPVGRQGLGRTFEPPETAYGPGHRGIDIAAAAGTPVRAAAPGTVTFVGRVGRVDVVTIGHGAERSTYQPVSATVQRGDAITRDQVIGTLQPGPSHCGGACLHLGRLRPGGVDSDRTYLDPLDLLGGGRFRLITPKGPPPAPPAGAGGSLRRPVAGPVTSPYGMRVHPITGVRKLHDGTDFAAPCGTPVRAAAAGVVRRVPTDGAYGKRVVIEHAGGLTTAYAHLSSRSVSRGDRVSVGEVIGRAGNTGLSTGCHLHLMTLITKGGGGARTTDPASYL